MALSVKLTWATREDYALATLALLEDRLHQQRYLLGQGPATIARIRSQDEQWIGLIARDAEHDMPIGAAELCRGSLSFLVASSWRRLGVARQLARQVIERDTHIHGPKTMSAHVLRSNVGSRRVLEEIGFVELAMRQFDVAPRQRDAVVFLERAASVALPKPAA